MATISDAVVAQYSANVYSLVRRSGSVLMPYVTMTDFKGERKFFDRAHKTTVRQYTGRYMPSPIIETPFSRRCLTMSEWDWGDMIDWAEDERVLIDPTSDVVYAGAAALGEKMDEIIRDAFDGNALEGKDGVTPVALPNKQIIPITAGSGTTAANQGMNLEKLILTKSLFGKADIDTKDPRNKLYFAWSQAQMDDMLRTTEATNRDYAAVQALVKGEIDEFMGFTFIRTERIKNTLVDPEDERAGNIWKCAAWCKSGIIAATPVPIKTKITEREDMSFNPYAYSRMRTGSMRIDDDKVVIIPAFAS